jgi:hypothetical protein
MINNKRGLSTVVTTLIIILLVLVAIGIIWVVIRGIVEGGSQSVDYGAKCFQVALSVTNITGGATDPTGVIVSRSAGGEDLSGVMVVYKNGTASSTIVDVSGNVGALETKTLTAANDLIAPSSVEVSPYFKDTTGQNHICSPPATYAF